MLYPEIEERVAITAQRFQSVFTIIKYNIWIIQCSLFPYIFISFIEEDGFILIHQVFEQLAFCPGHSFNSSKTFEMSFSNIGNEPTIGLGYFAKTLYFIRVIGSHFNNANFYEPVH